MKIGLVCACALAAVVASGRLARADHRRIHPKLLERPTLVVSGGLASFIDPGLRDVAGVGETWSARVAVGRPKGIRVEVAYTGSAQPLAASQGTWLVGNGAVATLRVNVAPGVYPFEPNREWRRTAVELRRLRDLAERLRALEQGTTTRGRSKP